MNRFKFVILFLGIFSFAFSQDFYDIETINTVELFFSQENWSDILEDYYEAGDEERLVANAVINGAQFDSVGVRYKGNSTYNVPNAKKPFNIKLDYIFDDQEIQNYGTLKLANGFKDPTMIRETLSYEIANQYMPSSKANYVKLYVNDNYIGLYTSVQSVDKYFMQTHFGVEDNVRIKGEIFGVGNDWPVWLYYGENPEPYADLYELKSDEGWEELINFLDILNNDENNVDSVLDIDHHLWMLAFDNLMVNLDAPINFAHNYYLYEDADGRFCPILWDLNENFGGFTNLHSSDFPLSLSDLQNLDPYVNINEIDYPIISKILSNPTYKKIYVAHMKTIIEDYFSNGYYLQRAEELQEIIAQEVQNDPNFLFGYNQFESNIYNSVGMGPMAIVGISQLMEPRLDYLLSHPDFTAIPPAISEIENLLESIASGESISIQAEVQNTTSVSLRYRQNLNATFSEVTMYDDGNHDDMEANDGIYGNQVEVGIGDFEFYIYAENEEAVSFMPKRAEHEFYSISIEEAGNNSIVINEFLASNDNYGSDQDGEYDDWIELYNNSDEAIDLTGFYLSDDVGELDKWEFPTTTIAPQDYLIIWADDDTEQDGLHTPFKLSASGESVVLSSPELDIIDFYTFSEQTTDISMGRYPNGSGDFTEMTPSFLAPNSLESIENEVEEIPNFSLRNYPNPFNPTTTFYFSLDTDSEAQLKIFNVLGQEIKSYPKKSFETGTHQITWDGKDNSDKEVSSGVYFYKLKINGLPARVKKCLLLK